MMSVLTAQLRTGGPGRRVRIAVVIVSVAVAAVGSVVLVFGHRGELATTSGVTATLRVAGHPDFAAADQSTLWLSTFGPQVKQTVTPTGRLMRIDLATGAAQRAVQLPGANNDLVRFGDRVFADPGYAGTSEGFSGPGEVLAVGWQTGRVLARRRENIGFGPMTVGGGALWAAKVKPGVLQELNPITLAPVRSPLALTTTRVYGLAWGDGYLWASASDDGNVLRIDPATRAIARVHVGGFPIGIVLAGGSVWIINNANATVVRLNPSTLREIGRPVRTPSGGAFYLGASDGYVFIANESDGTVTRIDERTGQPAGPPIRIAPPSNNPNYSAAYAIAPAGTTIWATSPITGSVSRIQAQP
jgi:hypothetical protein